MYAHGTVTTLVAAGDDLPPVPGIGAALGPSFVQVRLEVVELRGPALSLPLEEVFWGGGVGEAFDGPVGHVELAADGTPAVALGQ